VKIEGMTVQGFRGFNEQRSIDFHPNLTLIYGPNSYGKTSITEAVEWLLYGKTSKVDKADSKDEYRGSYRNCHLDSSATTFVKVYFNKDGRRTLFEAELTGEDGPIKSVDGHPVDSWPIDLDLSIASRPFIMQHALKYLLLVGPDGRFKGFAQLLGFDELGNVQSDFVSLCTKPESSIIPNVADFLTQIASIEGRLATRPRLKHLYTIYKKGKDSFPALCTCVWKECKDRVPDDVADESVLPNLLRIREEAVKEVFSGRITLTPYTSEDKSFDAADLEYFVKFASEDFIKEYCELIGLTVSETILKQAELYRIGMEFLKQKPTECPFCGQRLTSTAAEHISKTHEQLKTQSDHYSKLLDQKQVVIEKLSNLQHRLDKCQQRHISRLVTFLSIRESLGELAKILLPKYESHIKSIRAAITQLQKLKEESERSYTKVHRALESAQVSVQQSKEEVKIMEDLGQSLVSYSAQITSEISLISAWVSPMSDANEILKHELDAVAGTEDISILIDLVEKQKEIKKSFDIEAMLEGLKELRKTVDQYVGVKMLDAVTKEMTTDVMNWYDQIRTTGDPDVHFSGFDMDRTKKGDIKSRRVQVKASSYGKDLVSAVSSLSESKLNALGICLSIATNLKSGCPFGFLFIDDPIQSLDEEHEAQFVGILRKLVDNGKQIILLSHNKSWLDQVRVGCRSLNGLYYEITSYTKAGPNIYQKAWCSWRQRLDEVDAILKDTAADIVRLQHAAGEIRLVACELTADLYSAKRGVHKNSASLNASLVRKALLECSVSTDLVDRISQTFETTDKAHHVTDSSILREKIRRYHSWMHELAKLL